MPHDVALRLARDIEAVSLPVLSDSLDAIGARFDRGWRGAGDGRGRRAFIALATVAATRKARDQIALPVDDACGAASRQDRAGDRGAKRGPQPGGSGGW